MDYQGYKLLDKIILVCRDKSEHEDSSVYKGCDEAKSFFFTF